MANINNNHNKTNFWHKSLAKTNRLFEALGISKSSWGEIELEQCEEALIVADAGIQTANEIITKFRALVERKTPIKELLFQEIYSQIVNIERDINNDLIKNPHKPQIILIVGVNGAGKTTSIAKLTHYLLAKEKSVILAAGDTFRAAAREQLKHWGEHHNVRVIEQQGADPAAVAFDTIKSAIANDNDFVIVDTAGRLSSQKNLMAELTRIHKVCGKACDGVPFESWMVLDGAQGQNTLAQVETFNQAIPLTGLIVTKLDGSAKGGFLLALAKKFPKIPVVFIGLGEKASDLQLFDAKKYASSLINYQER